MSEPPDDAESEVPVEGGLDVERLALRGFATGAVVAAVVFGLFALLPGTARPLALYAGLAVVLGVSVGLLATLVLVGWRVRQLSRRF